VFFTLSKLLDVFLSPFTWGLVWMAWALPWRRPRVGTRRWRRKRAVGLVGLALLLVLGAGKVSNAILYRLEHATEPTYRPDVVYDAVILLGGVSDERVSAETGQPSLNENVERLTMTGRLLREGRARYVIISGAAMDPALEAFSEARVLGDMLEEWGIGRGRILLENRARNTHENAVFSRELALEHGLSRLLVVTSAFHMRRAAECFAAVGLPVDRLPVDYRASGSAEGIFPRAQPLADSTMALREIAGLYVYRFQGYAKPVR
jgi:uncharacterized SAM-binding protein YcdF (DUF218 family)